MPNESILSTGFHLYILPSWGRDPSDVYLMSTVKHKQNEPLQAWGRSLSSLE